MSRINFDDLPLSADQARAARNYFGWSQAKAAEESGLPINKLKRFESGNYVPDTQFLQELRDFFEGQGFEFGDSPRPGAKAREAGIVFPAGVVGAQGADAAPSRRPSAATIHHMRISIGDEAEMGHVLELIDANEERVEELLQQPVETGFFGGVSEDCKVRHAEVLALLAENGRMFARLFGREIGGTPSAEALQGEAQLKTHADLLHRCQADMHRILSGDRQAKTRRQAKQPANSLTAALFG